MVKSELHNQYLPFSQIKSRPGLIDQWICRENESGTALSGLISALLQREKDVKSHEGHLIASNFVAP